MPPRKRTLGSDSTFCRFCASQEVSAIEFVKEVRMKLSRTAGAVSFLGALAIGLTVAYVASGGQAESVEPVKVSVTYKLAPAPVPAYEVLVQAEDLEGVWNGTWDHGQV